MGSRPPHPPTTPPGGSIGPYRLANRIAVGGMAEVFRALDRPPAGEPRAVVIKRMLPALAAEEEWRRMFEDEARLGLMVRHPNVVEVLDTGDDAGVPYLVLEYVFGVDLWRLTRYLARVGQRLRPALVAYVATEMLGGLEAVHDARDPDGEPLHVVHRDVSPSNVFLSVHGDVKLGDLGIALASLRERRPVAPANTRAKGKLGYLAPEQVRGRPFDERADLFSAGVLTAELLMGRALFTGGGEIGVLLAIRDAHVEPFRESAERLPPGLGKILMGALTREPEDRVATAAALRQALLPYVEEPVAVLRRELGDLVATVVSELDAEEGTLDRRALAQTVERHADFFEAPTDPEPVEAVPSPTQEPDPSHYRVRTEGGAFGPWRYARLAQAIATGEVGADDEVASSDGKRGPVRSWPELARHLPPSSRTPTVRNRTRMAQTNELHDLSRGGGMLGVLARALADRQDGLLVCERGAVRKEVYLWAGVPVFVASNLASDLLGEYLVRQRVIDASELDLALAVIPRYEGRLGETLIALGLVEAVTLVRVMAKHVRDRLLDLFEWPGGRAAFYAGVDPPEGDFPLGIDPWELLEAGVARRHAAGLDEARFVGRSSRATLRVTEAAATFRDPGLPSDVAMLLASLERPRSLADLEEMVGDDGKGPPSRARRLLTILLEAEAVRWDSR